jgi:hypothetical protein
MKPEIVALSFVAAFLILVIMAWSRGPEVRPDATGDQ